MKSKKIRGVQRKKSKRPQREKRGIQKWEGEMDVTSEKPKIKSKDLGYSSGLEEGGKEGIK